MTAPTPYVPQARHRIRRQIWGPDEYVDVIAVGEDLIFGTDQDGQEGTWFAHNSPDLGPWVKVVALTPLPESWHNVYPHHIDGTRNAREVADEYAHPNRIAVLHVCPDGTVEVIRTDGSDS